MKHAIRIKTGAGQQKGKLFAIADDTRPGSVTKCYQLAREMIKKEYGSSDWVSVETWRLPTVEEAKKMYAPHWSEFTAGNLFN